MSISIPLKNHLLIIDDEDLSLVNQYRWSICKFRPGFCVVRYYLEGGQRKTMFLARTLVNAQPGDTITYENGNSLDCRKSNLILTKGLTKGDIDYIRSLYNAGRFHGPSSLLLNVAQDLHRSPATLLHIARYECGYV